MDKLEGLILDENFEAIYMIDAYESFIWKDRYNGYGDFELYTRVEMELLQKALPDRFVWIPSSQHLMVIDKVLISSDLEKGNMLTISGSSLEVLLTNRIVWVQTNLSGNLQNGIEKLLNENVINASIVDRRIPNFIFEPSTDPRITGLTVDAQFTGNELYDAIQGLCEVHNLGFRVILDDQNRFVFSLYVGDNRSYTQEINPYVTFSQDFDNLITSNYLETTRLKKTVALVRGEGEGTARRTVVVGGGVGMKRKELDVDARDVSSETDAGILNPTQYNAALTQRGTEKLAEHDYEKIFDADVETTQMYIYDRDFFMGDIVQFRNEFGIEQSVRVMEVIFSYNEGGPKVVPTFKVED